MLRRLHSVAILACATCLSAAAPIRACSTPVFRYALENWPAAPYELIVFQKGELPADLSKMLDELRNNAKDFNANLTFTTIDTGNVPEEYQKVANSVKDSPLPWMVLRYPATVSERTIFSGPLKDRNSIVSLIDSPARKQIARRIAEGNGAVWLLVDGGNKEADDKAAKLVESQIKEMSDQFTKAFQAGLDAAVPNAPNEPDAPPAPPATAEQPPVQPQQKGPQVGCSLVRIAKGDKAEAFFIHSLTEYRSNPEKKEGDDAHLYLVFGRGRMLGPLTGNEIVEQNIQAASGFLTGPCMCEIKAQNPGIDLLMNIDWDMTLDTLLHGPQPDPVAPAKPTTPEPPKNAPTAEQMMNSQQPANTTPPAEPVALKSTGALSLEPGSSPVFLFALGLIAAGVLVVVVSMREKRRVD